MFANLCGMKPWEKSIDVIEEITVDDDQLKKTINQNLQDVTILMGDENFQILVVGFQNELLPSLHEEHHPE